MNFVDLLVANLLGLVVGIAASFASWWILFHRIVPCVEFSSAISATPRRSNPDKKTFRFKLQNTGRRAVIGSEVFARLRIKWPDGNNWTGYYIPLGREGERKYELPRLERSRNRTLTLWINRTESFRSRGRFPDDFRAKAETRELTLADVLSQGTAANLQIFLSGYDEFSGARKIFMSKQYTLKDVLEGRFRGLSVEGNQSEEEEQKDADAE